VIALRECDDHAETGEVLLSFLDADECEVTLRLSAAAFEALRKRLAAEPDPHAK
jgi:hypothetical protein